MPNPNYQDSYYGSILDPLHGDIKLSEIEKWCISQPIFSRLRGIKQNTFLYYVFPSANHTRFEHSIGVMHLAGKIFDSCQDNFATGERKMQKYSQQFEKKFFDLNKLGGKVEVFYQELRLAGLLHDIGHGPMSHLFDQYAIGTEIFLKIIGQEPLFKNYIAGFETLLNGETKVEHEIVSCAFIFYLIDKLKKDCLGDPYKFSSSASRIINSLSAERIVSMVEFDFTGLSDILEDDDGNNYTSFFSQIISAFPIDADRMDYLLRDSYFSGVTYGIYDINRIFASFQATLENQSTVKLCFKESGIDSMLRFIQSRSHLYNQIYFHKTNRAANTMLIYATENYSSKHEKILNGVLNFEEFADFYIQNSDEYFINNTVKTKMINNKSESMILNNLIDRKLFKRIWQKKIVIIGTLEEQKSKIKELRQIKDVINKKLKDLELKEIFSKADMSENQTFKDVTLKSISIAAKVGRGKYEFKKNWNSFSREFQLSDMSVCVMRVFLCRTFHSPDEYLQKCMDIETLISEEIGKLNEYE